MYTISAITDIVSNIIFCVTGGVAIWQLLLMKKKFKADHERRKKQATIEFFYLFYKDLSEILKSINKIFPTVNYVIKVDDIKNDSSITEMIKEYLRRITIFGVGVNTGIYDINVLDRIAETNIINSYNRFKEIIKWRRDIRNDPTLFADFDKLVSGLEETRKKRFPHDEKDLALIKGI